MLVSQFLALLKVWCLQIIVSVYLIHLKYTNEQGHSVSYKIACLSREDLDQPAYQCSLIRIFVRHSIGSNDPKRLQADSEL